MKSLGITHYFALTETGCYFLQENALQVKNGGTMKKSMYAMAYVAACLSSTGLLFKIQHWPGASIMLVLGVAILNFGFLPLYFLNRYRQSGDLVNA
ncbi:MAG TPA: hypothetical protein VK177_21590 [Flavobacteriales bacterium]|nr:hypothetical protein [Flavobacteriales bacterium]